MHRLRYYPSAPMGPLAERERSSLRHNPRRLDSDDIDDEEEIGMPRRHRKGCTCAFCQEPAPRPSHPSGCDCENCELSYKGASETAYWEEYRYDEGRWADYEKVDEDFAARCQGDCGKVITKRGRRTENGGRIIEPVPVGTDEDGRTIYMCWPCAKKHAVPCTCGGGDWWRAKRTMHLDMKPTSVRVIKDNKGKWTLIKACSKCVRRRAVFCEACQKHYIGPHKH